MYKKYKNIALLILLNLFFLNTSSAMQVNGLVRFDEIFFFGNFENKQNEFPNGANLRSLDLAISGDVGTCLTYNMNFGLANGFDLNDAFITYTGFKPRNLEFSFGQVPSPFCLENNLSGKWIPFLERSLPSTTFSPCFGLGVSASHWGNWYGITLVASQPSQRLNQDDAFRKFRSDHWTFIGRATMAPYNRDSTVLHLGASAIYSDRTTSYRNGVPHTVTGNTSSGVRFRTYPEARARNTARLVDTGIIPLNNYYQLNGEIAYKMGPFWTFGDYFITRVNRPGTLENVQFQGWHAQAAYILTGETRTYDVKNGKFGKIKPNDPCLGAWEVATRYSVVDLNDKDILGGREHNTSLALNWYATENLKFMLNYIHARIYPSGNRDLRRLNILGFRAQLIF